MPRVTKVEDSWKRIGNYMVRITFANEFLNSVTVYQDRGGVHDGKPVVSRSMYRPGVGRYRFIRSRTLEEAELHKTQPDPKSLRELEDACSI